MTLTLEFHGLSLDQRGYMVIEKNEMRIGFLPRNTTDEAYFEAETKRDKFAVNLAEHVYPYLNEPAIRSFTTKNKSGLKALGVTIHFIFDDNVDYKTIWIFLLNIPYRLLAEAIDPKCVDDMLRKAQAYFCDQLDEEEKSLEAGSHTNENQSSSWLPAMISSSYLWFFGNETTQRNQSTETRSQATRAVDNALIKDAEWRKTYFNT